jgi:hypothetical protein
MLKQEKIDDLDNANITMSQINRKRGDKVDRVESIIEPTRKVSDMATCIKNPIVDNKLLKRGPHTIIRKIPRTSS